MGAVVEHSNQQEQRARADAMAEHLEHGALGTDDRHGGEPQHHEAHVGYGAVGYEFLDVPLHHGHQRAIDDGNDREHRDGFRIMQKSIGKHRNGKAYETVGTKLKQHARQDHRTGGGCLHMRIRQPGMQRKKWHLDGKGQREGQEQGALDTERQAQRRFRHDRWHEGSRLGG